MEEEDAGGEGKSREIYGRKSKWRRRNREEEERKEKRIKRREMRMMFRIMNVGWLSF